MSDPISITGLVISALGVAQWIFDYTSSCIDAPEHIKNLGVQVKLTSEALDMLRKHLQSPKSQTIDLERTSVLFTAAGGCYDLLGKLQKLLPSSPPTKKGHKIMQRLLWHLKKDDAENAVLSLRGYVQIFHFALDLDGLTSLSSKYEESSQFIIQKLEALSIQDAASDEEVVPVRQVLEDLKLVFMKAIENLEERLVITESDAKIDKLLSALDGLPFQERHIDLQMRRMDGLGDWLLLSPEFVGWREGSGNDRVLWCYGAPGVGKTYLSSVIIDHLQDRVAHTKGQVLYFYFDYGRQADQTPLKILISLLRQLITAFHGLPNTASRLIEHIEKGNGLPSWRFLVDNFIKICSTSTEVFLVLDALDECDEHKNRPDILDLLERLETESKIRILITSRPYPSDIKLAFANYPAVVIEASDADIRTFLANIISKCRRQWARRMLAGELGTRVINEITSKSRGMFLLPALQIDYLLNQTNEVEVDQALKTLPSGLQRNLDLTLARIKNQDSQGTSRADLAMRVLMWISHAERPLKIDELQIAVYPPFQTIQSNLDTACDLIMDCCLGLVAVDAQIRTIRLVHLSIDEYLQDRSSFLFPRAHQRMASRCTECICQFYQSHIKFPQQSNKTPIAKKKAVEILVLTPFLEYAINFWGIHASKRLDDQLERELIRFCDDAAVLNFWANFFVFSDSISIATLNSHQTDEYTLYRGKTKRFIYKPGPISILHVATIFGIGALVRNVLSRDKTALNSKDPFGRTALILSAAYGRSHILDILVRQAGVDLNAEDDSGNTALSIGAMLKNEPIVSRLSSLPDVNVNIGQPLPRAAGYVYSPIYTLKPASVQSADAVVKLLLLRPDLDVNQRGPDSYAPWEHLAFDFNPSALKSLLSRDDFQRGDETFRTIENLCDSFTASEFRWASHVMAAVQVLLELDRDSRFDLDEWKDCGFLNAIAGIVRFVFADDPTCEEQPDKSYKYTLDPGPTIVDSSGGNLREIIRSAMETLGLSMNSRDSRGRSFSHAFASQGNEAPLSSCPSYGLDIRARDNEGRTALHYAVKNGHMSTTLWLLKMGLDPNATDSQGWTAAHFAARLPQKDMLRYLRVAGADLSVRDVIGATLLHVAVGKSAAEDVIEYLIQEIGDVNAVTFDGYTPLHVAVHFRYIDLAKVLLRLGADPNISSFVCGTPLDRAAHDRDHQFAQALISAGADIDHRDIFGKTCREWLDGSVPSPDVMGSDMHTQATPPLTPESRDTILQYMAGRIRHMLKYKQEEQNLCVRLGRQLMILGDDNNAIIAASQNITSSKRNRAITWRHPCSNCPSQSGFLHVCRSCPAVHLCKQCVSSNTRERLPACRNHEFLKVPGDGWAGLREDVVDAAGRTFEEWLRHIQAKYKLPP